MKNKVKQILNDLDYCKNRKVGRIGFTSKECEFLLDYITNLQEENERLKLVIKNHSIIIPKNKIIDYKSRIEKAINHINEHQLVYISQYKEMSCFDNHLMDILQGANK